MANLIATEGYAKNIGGKNISYTSNLGCTKSRAIALGCDVAGTYANNQLVCQKDLSKAGPFTGDLPASGVLYTTSVPSGSSWFINGSTSNVYIVQPNPNPNIYSYSLNFRT